MNATSSSGSPADSSSSLLITPLFPFSCNGAGGWVWRPRHHDWPQRLFPQLHAESGCHGAQRALRSPAMRHGVGMVSLKNHSLDIPIPPFSICPSLPPGPPPHFLTLCVHTVPCLPLQRKARNSSIRLHPPVVPAAPPHGNAHIMSALPQSRFYKEVWGRRGGIGGGGHLLHGRVSVVQGEYLALQLAWPECLV